MAKKMIRELATELTAPRAAAQTASVSPAKPTARSTQSNMLYLVALDPIQEDLDLDVNPDINPRDVLRIRANRIVNKYETEAEKDEAERVENGGLTNAESYVQTALIIQHIYQDPPIFMASKTTTTVAAGQSIGMTLIGANGARYTAIYDENGNLSHYDTKSTTVAQAALAKSLTLRNDDLIDNAQKSNILYKLDKKGNLVERTEAEMQFQLALTRMDNDVLKAPYQLDWLERTTENIARQNNPQSGTSGSIMFKSAAPTGIATPVTPSAQFTEAASGDAAPAAQSKSIMFQNQPPKAKAPWETPDKVSKGPANEPKFELTA